MRQLNTVDRVIAGAAAVGFITLFLPWYGVTVGQVDLTGGAGVTGWAGVLCLTAAGTLLVLRRSGGSLRSGPNAGPSALVAGLAALGLLFVVVRWITLPRDHANSFNFSYSVGPRYGLYVALLAAVVETAAAVVAFRAAGQQRPWDQPAEPEPPAPPEEWPD